MERITAPDGAVIVLHTTGSGPGVVLVHGGGITIHEYRRLVVRLAERFTVHRYNRRGRADAPPRREPYSVEQEIEDLGAVLEHTGARNVLGHSYGGFVALRAALRLPIDRLALYDGAFCLGGTPSFAYLDAADEAIRDGDIAKALAIVGAGVNTQSGAARLPLGVRTAVTRAFLRTPVGRTMGALLPMTLFETRQIVAHDGPPEQYAGVTAEVLLACGDHAPAYFAEHNDALARVIPGARTLRVPRSRHDAIAVAHPRLVDPIAAFLGAPLAPKRAGQV
ncbi:alpha/beta fold hydrolase [Micromonospora sp. WMMD812]|uniref:alpha/beta fold hydrolase n=1 Tax=Micromonospora sp. WMMD812 TaxID=3015152 RepID=UPI00248B6400|nr:alpha/beta fold hydrolase [Micromonospora sp. WMMD812]WBB68475.1 alpha/beta fold hydrolase [Micromonospora sp. WMMD812]